MQYAKTQKNAIAPINVQKKVKKARNKLAYFLIPFERKRAKDTKKPKKIAGNTKTT